jgi:type IV pilus biogenesis protein CpaD/CtpE
MKMRLIVLALALTAAKGVCSQEKRVQAQAQSKTLNTQAYVQLLRADLKSQKEAIIKEAMQLNQQQGAAFWPIYEQYSAEQTKLGDEKLAIVQDYAANFLTMTNEKADELAQRVMQLDEKRMALREKYYAILKKALPAVLAVRFFQVENQIQLLLDLQIASNLPIIEGADNQ